MRFLSLGHASQVVRSLPAARRKLQQVLKVSAKWKPQREPTELGEPLAATGPY